MNDIMHRKRELRFEKKRKWSFSVRRRRLTFGARQGLAAGAACGGGGDVAGSRWKSRHRKIVPISSSRRKAY